jgi:hypothetical protein
MPPGGPPCSCSTRLTRNPAGLQNQRGKRAFITGQYLVGLQPKVQRDPVTGSAAA